MNGSTPGLPDHHQLWSLPKPRSIELVMPSNHHIFCRTLLLEPSTFPSIRVFSKESALYIRWSKYQSFSFIISPSNEHPGLISFRMDWLDLLAVQGTLKSLLQQHSSKASILWSSAFFIVQLSHPYTTTGKTMNSQPPLKARRSMEGFFSKAFRENMALLTPWFWTSIPQKCERIELCFLKHTIIHLLVISL